jgi:hypothetical protein
MNLRGGDCMMVGVGRAWRLAAAGTVAVCVVVGTAPLGADTYPRQPGIDVEHYVFRLDFRDDQPDIAGEASIRVRFTQPNVASLWFDLTSLSDGKGMTVSAVSASRAPSRTRMRRTSCL